MSRIFSSAEPGPQLTWTAMAVTIICLHRASEPLDIVLSKTLKVTGTLSSIYIFVLDLLGDESRKRVQADILFRASGRVKMSIQEYRRVSFGTSDFID